MQGEQLRQQLRQLQHYTGQLARDTAQQLMHLGELQVEPISRLAAVSTRLYTF
jgi:hypothetical protein